MLKRIIFTCLSLLIFCTLLYQISVWDQKNMFETYTFEFNNKRSEIGLKVIRENYLIDELSWSDWNQLNSENLNSNDILKYTKIFSLKDIQTTVIVKKESIDKDNFQHKAIFFNTNLLFWKNSIVSEIDVYRREINLNNIETLTIQYYHEDDNGNKNYCESYYSNIKLGDFYCGTPHITEKNKQRKSGKPYYGNINKKQADSILLSWNIDSNED